MEFSNIHVSTFLTHTSSILVMSQFKNNDEDHFFSLSDDGEMKEWLLESENREKVNNIELETYKIKRPSDEFLQAIGQTQTLKGKISNNYNITYCLPLEDGLILGYEDGLILYFYQEKRDVVNIEKLESLNLNKSMDLINPKGDNYNNYVDYDNIKIISEEIKQRNRKMIFDDIVVFSLQDDIDFIHSDFTNDMLDFLEEEIEGENDIKFHYKDYFNILWLKYIFIEQTQPITYLFLYTLNNKKDLISASKDYSLIIYNLLNGNLIYKITLDSHIKFISFCQDIPPRKKIPPKSFLTLLSNSASKITLDLEKGNTPIMNNYSFKYNDFNKVIYINKKFYLLGNQGNCVVYNITFQEIGIVYYKKIIPLIDIIPFRNYFLVFTNEFKMILCDFDFEHQKMKELFHIKFGRNLVNNLNMRDDILYVINKDGEIYSIDIALEYEIYEERCLMKSQEIFSDAFNKYYETHKSKKKKKGKKGGKKGGGKKASSPKKNSPSPKKGKKK